MFGVKMTYDQREWKSLKDNNDYAEFDWFGIDRVGNIGMFCSFGIGPVPKIVWSSLELYNELYEIIENLPEVTQPQLVYKGNGYFTDWLAYASKGLFAYDYHDIHRTKKLKQYDLIAVPDNPTKIEDLMLSQKLINYIPKLRVEFPVIGNIENIYII